MENHDGCERAFHWSAKAWYAKANDSYDEINFGMYDLKGGGTSGEMTMKWIDLGNRSVPQLQVFDDSWSALTLFNDVIVELGKRDSECISQEEFVEILKGCGFKDATAYTQGNETVS